MADLFNHRIDVKSDKSIDIAKMASNAFRSTQAKVATVITDVKEAVVEIKDEVVEVVKDVVEDVIEELEELIEDEDEVEVEDFLDISDLKVAELKEILDSKGVKYTATKKDDLIELVKGL